MVMFSYVAVLLFSLTLFAAPANSQSRTVPANVPQAQTIALSNESQMERAMMAGAVAQRQSQLRIDTEKLVALTVDLKQQVDKTGVNILSMDVIKKAQEIQKLAKSVQDKMKNAY
jgi:hypothetical protein